MTKREKILAGVVAALAPLALLFFGFMWFADKMDANYAEIDNLIASIDDEKDRAFEAMNAQQRREYYRKISISSDLQRAKNDYSIWLSGKANEFGLDGFGFDQITEPERKYGDDKIFDAVKYPISFGASIDQLSAFLYDFETAGVLHRIVKFEIIPPNRTVDADADSAFAKGLLRVSMEIEVLSLVDADAFRDLDDMRLPPETFLSFEDKPEEVSVEDYKQNVIDTIVNRNIFSPGNTAPVFETDIVEVTAGTSISFAVAANDSDRKDRLVFELVSSELPGATINQPTPTSKRINFSADAAEISTYKVVIKATDNGNPRKSTSQEITVNVVEKANSPPSFVMDRTYNVPCRKPISIPIVATDEDADDNVEFRIISFENEDEGEAIEGAEIVAADDSQEGAAKSRQAELVYQPGLEPGEYKLELEALDDAMRAEISGNPEEDEKRRKVTKTVTVVVDAPSFYEAQASQYNFKGSIGGERLVGIKIRTRGVNLELSVGDDFELDEKTWTVHSISEEFVLTLEVDGRLQEYLFGDFLASPRNTVEVAGANELPESAVSEEPVVGATEPSSDTNGREASDSGDDPVPSSSAEEQQTAGNRDQLSIDRPSPTVSAGDREQAESQNDRPLN